MIKPGTLCYVTDESVRCPQNTPPDRPTNRIVEVIDGPHPPEPPNPVFYLEVTWYNCRYNGRVWCIGAYLLRPISDPDVGINTETPHELTV